ncbi:alpha-tocopherol transfer protein-like [Mercenaria mercenaria]|uniref:alpha-tocopherol transfer protein-like n=1 Tax=Mercenaria mercenaria TaxID=6596 RepID=UPI00234F00E7|nr:alpha-tocopherol transfer protein-like [Mercenaria mercenaria]
MSGKSKDVSYVCTLSDELVRVAKKELNEIPEKRAEDINTLRKRILKHPGLNICTDDAYLLKFLRASAFDQDAAYTLILKYFEMKADEKNKQLFTDLRSAAVKHVVERGVVGLLPHRDKQGRSVVVFRPGKWDTSQFGLADMFKTIFMLLIKLAEDEETQIRGCVVLYDMDAMGFGHLTHISPFYAKRSAMLFQDCVPVRFKYIHVVNEPAVFDYLFALGRPFMSQESIDKVLIHGHKLEELAEYFDLDYLPTEYGGKAPPLSNQELKRAILDRDKDFDAEAKNGLVNAKSESSMDGITGTYRKLEI